MKEQFEISADSFRAQMKLPPQLKKPFDAGVRNGLLMLFSKGAREESLDMLAKSTNMAKTLADAAFSTVFILHEKSNGTMPPQIIVPVGVELLAHCFEVAQKAGIPMDNNDVAEAMGLFVGAVLKAANIGPEQMQQMVGGMDSGAQAPAQGG